MLRQLAPDRCPTSCEECGGSKAELTFASREAWQLYLMYPSLIRHGLDGSWVDYATARWLAEVDGLTDPLLLRRLEAIRQGLTDKTK